MGMKNHLELLEILRLWLEDNIDMESELEFTDGVTSADMLPMIKEVESLLDMPKAKRGARPWQEYYYTEAVPSMEMNRAESQVWNEARDYVLNRLKGKSG